MNLETGTREGFENYGKIKHKLRYDRKGGTKKIILTGLKMSFGTRRNGDKGENGQLGINEQKLRNCINTINDRDADLVMSLEMKRHVDKGGIWIQWNMYRDAERSGEELWEWEGY